MFDKGFFGTLFDLNGDGELDAMEKALDLCTFAQLMEECEKENDPEK